MSRRSNDIKLQRQKAQSRIYPDKPTDVDPKVKQSMADAIANYTGPITRIPPVKKKESPESNLFSGQIQFSLILKETEGQAVY